MFDCGTNVKSGYLVLFDIDGTLLSAGGAGYFALERAIVEILGASSGLLGISLDGNTDRNALLQISARDSTPFPDNSLIEKFKSHYSEILLRELSGKGDLKPGVVELLDELIVQPDTVIALVTGNFREGAEIKLARFNIQHYFKFGAFGCEHHERSELIKLAVQRAEKFYPDLNFSRERIVMIGDTINDIKACTPSRIRSIATATGSYSLSQLADAGADLAVEDLSDTERIISWIRK
ncbi:MAG: HAD hydrolase-like protein [Candidatus Riflebacteria bacterium]|nr:HAD hydrolase-like protein [Candidatus Riflebacteria bacterium]